MKSIEESIAASMDCTDLELLSYLPYILQDFWEIGASPKIIIDLVRKHMGNYSFLEILDLGCGKGAVSIKLALELKCHCLGIDAIKEFIDDGKRKAQENNVESLCTFENNDIRQRIATLKDFDVIVLGATGPVFGNYHKTFSKISNCLKREGIIIIDDGYIEDDKTLSHSFMEKKKDILCQADELQIQLIDEVIASNFEKVNEEYDIEYEFIVKRCTELIEKYPYNASLFESYKKKQNEEYDILKNKVICSTMVFRKM
jgi:SAM-dependent methyltransferase